ncbi:MAG: TetR/AcrR family transcriptional regulator [Thermodesulfobacteriota bacterium]
MESPLTKPTDTFWNLPADKRGRILAEAAEEFAAKGYAKASLNAVVRRLGIAKGSVYQYFANKEALFLFVFEELTREVKRSLTAALAALPEQELRSSLREALFCGMRFIDQHPAFFRLYLRIVSEDDLPHREQLLARVRLFSRDFFLPLCTAAQAAGQLEARLDPEAMAFVLDAVFDRFLQSYAAPSPGVSFSRPEGADWTSRVQQLLDVFSMAWQTGEAAGDGRDADRPAAAPCLAALS